MPEKLRQITRPVVTFWLAFWYAALTAYQMWYTHELPLHFVAAFGGVTTWWFYDRFKMRHPPTGGAPA